jgi:serine phosphatase RsbU (regulator of sigma subunit)
MVYQLQIDTDLSGRPGELLSTLADSSRGMSEAFLNKALRIARHAEHDLLAAQEVQSWLFPRHCPILTRLAYAGACRQARELGGDFYDFIDHGDRQLGIVVGDIAGKGIAAALSMATLRTLLRSQCPDKAHDLSRLLASVNRSFHESTPSASYATLFLAHYDDGTRRLRYVNCGHPGPIVLRASGEISRLDSTAPAVGLFSDWQGSEAHIELAPGDMLAIYTDGITEAVNSSDEDFGIDGLIQRLIACQHLSLAEAARRVLEDVLTFSDEQQDDLTLVAARVF